MKIALIVFTVVITVLLVILIVGAALPRDHIVSRYAIFRRPPHEVYSVIRDFSSAPKWRFDLKGVELIPTPDNRVRFRENGKQGAVTYDLVEDRPNEKMLTRIADQDLGYSGTWTYTFQSTADGTRLEITETGNVSNILFRFVSRFVFGHTGTIEKFLVALGKKFGEDVSPQP